MCFKKKNMKHFRFLLPLFFLGFMVSSCGETCEVCTITQEITEDGVVIATQTLNTNQEFCGDALDEIKDTESTITQTSGTVEVITTTTVDCQ